MNKYLRATSANFISFVINVIFFLMITPLAIKVMGEEFYGSWAVLSALMLFSNVGNLGIGAVVMKFSSEAATQENTQKQSNRVMTAGYFLVFAMSVIMALLLLLTRNLIADNINASTEIRGQFHQAVLWIAASTLPQFLARVPQGFLLARLHNRMVRQIELFSSISLWLGAIWLATVEKNLVVIAIWCFLNRVLIFGMFFTVVQKHTPFRLEPDMPAFVKMLNFSGYMSLESLSIALFQQFDKVIVSFTLGPALAGVYSVGTSLALRLSMVIGQATEVMIPYASLQESLKDQQKLYNTFRRLSRYISLALAGMSSLLIIWMNEILSLWISPDYATRYADDFRILIIAYSLLSLSRPAHQTLTGVGKVKFTAFVYLLLTILMLIGLFFFSREFGLLGAVISNLVLVCLLVFNFFVYYMFESPLPWRNVLTDLQWGLFLPVSIYGLSLLSPKSNLIYKLVETITLGILFSWIMTKDAFLKAILSQIKQSVIKSRT